MKCSACKINDCRRKYENRGKCVGKNENIDCTCTCQVSGAEKIATTLLSLEAGTGAVVGGISIIFLTGKLAYLIGGCALIGAGLSLIINPIQKQISGERMTLANTSRDAALGATIGLMMKNKLKSCFQFIGLIVSGAITGPIGSGASGIVKNASGLTKFGVRVGVGVIAGSVSGTVAETAKVMRGENVSIASYSKAIGIGAVAGCVGGASSHMQGSIENCQKQWWIANHLVLNLFRYLRKLEAFRILKLLLQNF
jgi:hypothetical protein